MPTLIFHRYKVLLKRLVGDVSAGAICLLLSTIALLNITVMWVVWVGLLLGRVETFQLADMPWTFLCLSSVLGLMFNFLINFGISYTYVA